MKLLQIALFGIAFFASMAILFPAPRLRAVCKIIPLFRKSLWLESEEAIKDIKERWLPICALVATTLFGAASWYSDELDQQAVFDRFSALMTLSTNTTILVENTGQISQKLGEASTNLIAEFEQFSGRHSHYPSFRFFHGGDNRRIPENATLTSIPIFVFNTNRYPIYDLDVRIINYEELSKSPHFAIGFDNQDASPSFDALGAPVYPTYVLTNFAIPMLAPGDRVLKSFIVRRDTLVTNMTFFIGVRARNGEFKYRYGFTRSKHGGAILPEKWSVRACEQAVRIGKVEWVRGRYRLVWRVYQFATAGYPLRDDGTPEVGPDLLEWSENGAIADRDRVLEGLQFKD